MPDNVLLACHLIPALSATATGAYVVAQPKGTLTHKRWGTRWSLLMLITALTSFGLTGGQFAVFHGYSYIHLLSILTLVMVPLGFWAIRQRHLQLHRFTMISLFISLCITGVLAVLMKGRFLNALMF